MPSPLSSRAVIVSMFFIVLSRLSMRRLQLGRASRAPSLPVAATCPCVVPTSVLIDSVISRTFLIDSLTSPASAVVTPSTLAAMWSTRFEQALERDRSCVSISLLTLSAMSVMVPEVSLRTSSRMSCRIGSSVPTSSMMSPMRGRLADVLDLVAVLEHAHLRRFSPFTTRERRARIDLQVVLAEQRGRLLGDHGVLVERDARLHADGDLRAARSS